MIKRLPWLRRLKKTVPEPPLRLPIAMNALQHGRGRLIAKLVHEKAEAVARREGIDRREFMASACGMATTLYMTNLVNGCGRSSDAGRARALEQDASMDGGTSPSPPLVDGGSPAGSVSHGLDAGRRDSAIGLEHFDFLNDAMVDEELARCLLHGHDELIIDMQTHVLGPASELPQIGAGRRPLFSWLTADRHPWLVLPADCQSITYSCFELSAYIDLVMHGSDTTMGVMSGLPYAIGSDGTGYTGFAFVTNERMLENRSVLDQMFPRRTFSGCMVMANDRPELQRLVMERRHGQFECWALDPAWSPGGDSGYALDDAVGARTMQWGIDLASPIFCVQKGLPLQNRSNPDFTGPSDVGRAAKLFPEARIVVYGSAFEHGLQADESSLPDSSDAAADLGWGPGVGMWPEGPYDEHDAAVQDRYPLDRGVNSLIKSLRDNDIGPNGTALDSSGAPTTHVYAECGGAWANLMLRPIEAQHYFGKLLKHIGEDRILWGTSCLWYGSPQPLIEAFRAFEISRDMQERYGYPALTPARKLKILGINAAKLLNGRINALGRQLTIDPQSCHSDYVGALALQRKRDLDEEWGPRRDMIAQAPVRRTRRQLLRRWG